ncbi:MAG: DUF1329 domain-containing protein [Proteobacteria bacterium]|nr:DUF1329 domain-containing protein [Pseudomonadota bacterium]
MKIYKTVNLAIVLIAFIFTLLLPGALIGADIPSIKDVVEGKAALPTIEDLTGGKVKIGDLIDKNNVDLVKEYITAAMYVNVKRGMVLKMGTQLSPDKLYPKAFKEATERNRGKAVMNNNGAVYYEKIGTPWPGGIPFAWAKNGLEAMGNYQYGRVWDSYIHRPVHMWYINSKGEVYKSVGQEHMYVRCSGRTIEPPLGTIPGYENILIKRITVATYPREIAGLGQFTVRYYDSAKDYDTGFAYLPAFKRTMRTSATTWQDNIAGADLIYGDGDGFQEPYSDWDLKLIGKKYLLVSESTTNNTYDNNGKPRIPTYDEKRKPADGIQFDVGKKFARIGWVIMPVDVVEAIPRFKHVYGKRVVYIPIWPYIFSGGGIAATDIYDRQMKLWKGLFHIYGRLEYINGDQQKPVTPYTSTWYYDLQADHTTQMWMPCAKLFVGFSPEDINLTTLLKKGR